MLYVNASEVAKLIGRNPYESTSKALLNVLSRSREWGPRVEALRTSMGVVTVSDTLKTLSEPAQLSMSRGVADAISANSIVDLDKAIQHAVDDVTRQEHTRWLEIVAVDVASKVVGGSARATMSVDAAMAVIASDPAVAQKAGAEAAARAAESMAVIAPALTSSIVMARGTALEAGAINEYERAHSTRVANRNDTRLQLRTRTYVITGYLDGFDESSNTLIEVKNRTRRWDSVPDYDMVQVHVYLEMLKHAGRVNPKAVLIERFPGGDVRETAVAPCAPDEWLRIDATLQSLARRVASMTSDNLIQLMQHT